MNILYPICFYAFFLDGENFIVSTYRSGSNDKKRMSMTKLNIQEANSHLRQLHKRVYELETKIHMQSMHLEELQTANSELKQHLKSAQEEKAASLMERDEQISELRRSLEDSEKRVQSLLTVAEERDKVVERLEKKSRLFYEVVEHRATLANMVKVLEELSCEESHLEEEDGEMNSSSKGDFSRSTSQVSSAGSAGDVAQLCNGRTEDGNEGDNNGGYL